MYKLLSALQYLQKNNIIHRDIKLDNIVINRNNQKGEEGGEKDIIIKIIDFGFAIQSNTIIKCHQIIGTPQYISPESIQGIYSHRSDIWSCGIIFYALLTGNTPFRAPSKTKIYSKIKN